MKVTAKIELPKKLTAKFNELKMPLSGGYDKGYEDGKEAGYVDGVKDGEAIGYEKGHADGYEDGYSDGSAYYDQFWDAFQDNGNRTDYQHAFMRSYWNETNFNPKYKIAPTIATNMFQYTAMNPMSVSGGKLDFSNCAQGTFCFSYCTTNQLGDMDLSNIASMSYFFGGASNLESIGTIKVSEKCNNFGNAFSSDKKLHTVTFDGTIIASIDFKSCPLTVVSMKSIIGCLKDYTGSGREFLFKLSFSDTCWAALEADSASPNGNTWKEYCVDLGWNV